LDRLVRHSGARQDCLGRTAEAKYTGQDSRGGTARIGQNCLDKTADTKHTGQNSKDRTGKPGQAGQDRTAGTGQPWQASQITLIYQFKVLPTVKRRFHTLQVIIQLVEQESGNFNTSYLIRISSRYTLAASSMHGAIGHQNENLEMNN
jgi:hypothetical protein